MLQTLHMDFVVCKKLADISALGPGLKGLKMLQTLSLNFRNCPKLRRPLQRDFYDRGEFLSSLRS